MLKKLISYIFKYIEVIITVNINIMENTHLLFKLGNQYYKQKKYKCVFINNLTVKIWLYPIV